MGHIVVGGVVLTNEEWQALPTEVRAELTALATAVTPRPPQAASIQPLARVPLARVPIARRAAGSAAGPSPHHANRMRA